MRSLRIGMRWLAASALLGAIGIGRAAVMTGKITEAGAGPYKFGYILAQDVQTMNLIVHKSDGSSVATIPITDSAALTKGAHEAATSLVQWDGKISGNPAPAGQYYPEIATTGAAVSTITLLSGPTLLATNAGGKLGRSYYGGDANTNAASVFHNIAYFGVCDTPTGSGFNGVTQIYPDASSAVLFQDATKTGIDYVGATVLADDSIVAGNQLQKALKVIDPSTGTLLNTYNAVAPDTRWLHGFGSGTSAKIFYADDSTTGGISLLDPIGVAAKNNIVTQAALNAASATTNLTRGFAINRAQTAMYISGVGYVLKFAKQGDGTWAQDTSFILTVNPANYRGLALSADEKTLFVTNNGGAANTYNYVRAYDAALGDPELYNYDCTPANPVFTSPYFTPQGIAVTSGGNIYVTGGNNATTSANSVIILAPPDSGSSDSTRGGAFTVTPTVVNIVLSSIADNITYHDNSVTWTSAPAGDSVIQYGLSSGTLDQTVHVDALSTSHSLTLPDLQQNTQYFYRVSSSAPGDNSGISDIRSFTTHTLTISNLSVPTGTLGANVVTVSWDTNEPASTLVSYDLTSPVSTLHYSDTTTTLHHAAVLNGFTPGTQYYYHVESGWPVTGVLGTKSAEATFTTPAQAFITSESFTTTDTTATLTFATDTPQSATVKYGTSSASLGSNASITGDGTPSHTATFSGLTAGTTYYYALTLAGASVGERGSVPGVFTTGSNAGTAKSVVQNSAAGIAQAVHSNVSIGASPGLISLEKQGIPGTPAFGPDLPVENYYSAVVANNGYLYVIGGNNAAGSAVNTVYYCAINSDGTLDTVNGWRATTALPTAVTYCCNQAFAYSGYLYLVGGYTTAYSAGVYYAPINADGTVGAWVTSASLPGPRGLGSAVAIDGYAMVTGGFDNVSARSTTFTAQLHPDGSLGPWSSSTPLRVATDFHRTAVNAHTLYTIGDYPNSSAADCQNLDSSASFPTGDLAPSVQQPAMDDAHFAMAGGLLRGKLVAAAGRTTLNGPRSLISHALVAADGTVPAWINDQPDGGSAAYPVTGGVMDLDGKPWNGRLYCCGGRQVLSATAPTAVKSTVVIPMDDDTSDPAVVYAYTGTFESQVVDLSALSNLKHFTVAGTNVSSASVAVRYRFAVSATSTADPVFTDWFDLGGVDNDISGSARYFQYQLILKGDGTSTPAITSASISLAPRVAALPGDINKDGVVDANDVKMAIRIAAGLQNAGDPTVSFTNGNLIVDTLINLLDADAILRKINNK